MSLRIYSHSFKMTIKSDRWIRRMAAEHRMIEPFEPGQIKYANGQQDRVLRNVELWLRYPLLGRIQAVHQHQLHHRRPQEFRREVLRRCEGRRVHHPAQFLRAGAHRRVFPHSAQRADHLPGKIHLCPLRHHRQCHAVRAGMGRAT